MTTTMAERMNDDPDHQPGPERVRRGRRMALLLFAIGFGPMVLAAIMYYTGWLNPGEHTNNGVLVVPLVPVAELHLADVMGRPLESHFAPAADTKWLMVVVADDCSADCESLMYLSRQVNIALGKNANRVGRAVYVQTIPEELQARWHQYYLSMQRLTFTGAGEPEWPTGVEPQKAPRMLLVDPMGNVMMHYGTEHSGKDILGDLQRLMRISQIG